MQKTIGNSFVVTTVEDGESAPYYFDEWFAWSNDKSTANVNVSPTIPSGHTWEDSIPNSYATYLWRKSIRNVWDENKRIYIKSREAQYYRMTGDAQYIYLKGTARDTNSSITTQIPPIVNVNGGTNLAIYSRGLNLVTINRQTLAMVESINYDTYGEASGASGATGITDLIAKLNTLDDRVFVCLVSSDAIGWSNGLIAALQGYGMGDLPYTATGRYPFLFIGYKNLDKGNGLTRMRNVGSYTDVVELSVYIANGALTIKDGDDGVSYSIDVKPEQVVIGGDATGSNWLGLAYFYKNVGGTTSSHSAYFALYSRSNNGIYTRQGYSRSAVTGIDNLSGDWGGAVTTSTDALVIYIGTSSFGNSSLSNVEPTTYTMKYEIPVLKNGNTGPRGKVGRWYYYGGLFDSSDNSTQFVVNDATTPFFLHYESNQPRYHVFDTEDNPQQGEMTMAEMWMESGGSFNNAPWVEMTNDFKYLITEALFTAYAHLGGAIVNGDWMLSQYGIIYDEDGVAHHFDNPSATSWYDSANNVTYTLANAFTAFNPAYINSPHDVGYTHFIPTYCVDFLTGKTYQRDSYVEGEIHATSGTFNNVNISGRSTFGGLFIKSKTTITTSNISSYSTSTASGYLIDLEKTGTWMWFTNFEIGATIVLPSFRGSTRYGGTKDYIRSLIGNTVLVYYSEDQQGGGIILYGFFVSNGSNYTDIGLQDGQFAQLICKLRVHNNSEEVYWEVHTNGNLS